MAVVGMRYTLDDGGCQGLDLAGEALSSVVVGVRLRGRRRGLRWPPVVLFDSEVCRKKSDGVGCRSWAPER